jgi:FkbM family methyltransferase
MNSEKINLQNFLNFCQNKNGYSQLKQDFLAAYFLEENKFFVEFGATDGISLSNTFLLESEYGWNGILCEPGINWHEELVKNRNVSIDFRCVSTKSKEIIDFAECGIPEISSMLSHIHVDHWYEQRKKNKIYQVETVTLDDLLIQNNAPSTVDYISIDTEGSELDILESFSFDWNTTLFTVEHNYIVSKRDSVQDLMASKGYVRIFPEISEWDDWYIHV